MRFFYFFGTCYSIKIQRLFLFPVTATVTAETANGMEWHFHVFLSKGVKQSFAIHKLENAIAVVKKERDDLERAECHATAQSSIKYE